MPMLSGTHTLRPKLEVTHDRARASRARRETAPGLNPEFLGHALYAARPGSSQAAQAVRHRPHDAHREARELCLAPSMTPAQIRLAVRCSWEFLCCTRSLFTCLP